VGVAERAELAWADRVTVVLQRLALAASRAEDLAARLEVLVDRLEGLVQEAPTAQALRSALEAEPSTPDTA
jgi:hypothetical protein